MLDSSEEPALISVLNRAGKRPDFVHVFNLIRIAAGDLESAGKVNRGHILAAFRDHAEKLGVERLNRDLQLFTLTVAELMRENREDFIRAELAQLQHVAGAPGILKPGEVLLAFSDESGFIKPGRNRALGSLLGELIQDRTRAGIALESGRSGSGRRFSGRRGGEFC